MTPQGSLYAEVDDHGNFSSTGFDLFCSISFVMIILFCVFTFHFVKFRVVSFGQQDNELRSKTM